MKKRAGRLWQWLRKEPLFAVILVVELLVLAEQIFLWNFSTAPTTVTAESGIEPFSESSVKTEQGVESGNEYEIFGTTRWLALRGGAYDVTMHYTADEGTDAYASSYANLVQDDGAVNLTSDKTEATMRIWLPQRVSNFQMHFILNYGHVVLHSVDVVPVSNSAVVLNLLFVFALADFLGLLFAHKLPFLGPKASATLLILLCVTVFASAPMLSTQLMYGDDITFHLHRIEGLADELRLGTPFPVYLQSDWFGGQGYPVSTFYCDLFLYIPALLRLAGFPLQMTFQAYVVLINALTAVVAWWSFRHIFKSESAALTGSALLTLAPYRLTDLYLRDALGEYTAMAFMPLILAGLWDIFTLDPADARYRRCWIPVALGFWGVLQSHLISTEMCGLFTVAVCLVLLRRTLRLPTFVALCKAAGTALVASAWFLVPMLDSLHDGGYIITQESLHSDMQYAGSFLGQLMQVFGNGSGTAKSLKEGLKGDMVQTPGAALLVALLIFLVLVLLYGRGKNSTAWRAGRVGALGGVAALVLCLWTTPWDLAVTLPLIGKVFGMVQFPWRYLGIGCILFAVVAGAVVELLRPRQELRAAVICLLAGLCILEAGYTMSTCWDGANMLHVCDLSGLDSFACGGGEYLPDVFDVDEKDYYRANQQPEAGENATINQWQRNGTTCTVDLVTTGDAAVTVPLFHYPNYRAFAADGTELTVQRSVGGQVQVLVPAGYSGNFTVRYCTPWYWRGALFVSVLFVLVLFAAGWLGRRAKLRRTKPTAASVAP